MDNEGASVVQEGGTVTELRYNSFVVRRWANEFQMVWVEFYEEGEPVFVSRKGDLTLDFTAAKPFAEGRVHDSGAVSLDFGDDEAVFLDRGCAFDFGQALLALTPEK